MKVGFFLAPMIAPKKSVKLECNLIFIPKTKNLDESPAESISLLRGVIHECHWFLKVHQDPSVLYATPMSEKSSSSTTPSLGRRMKEEWTTERPLYPPPGTEKLPHTITHPGQEKEKKWYVPRVLPISLFFLLSNS